MTSELQVVSKWLPVPRAGNNLNLKARGVKRHNLKAANFKLNDTNAGKSDHGYQLATGTIACDSVRRCESWMAAVISARANCTI